MNNKNIRTARQGKSPSPIPFRSLRAAACGLLLTLLLPSGAWAQSSCGAAGGGCQKGASACHAKAAVRLAYAFDYVQRGQSSIEVLWPVGGDSAIVDSIRGWINGQLGGTYQGPLADDGAMMAHYAQQIDTLDTGYGEYSTDRIAPCYDDSRAVTLMYDNYTYLGGAHGMGCLVGATFRKQDGLRFTQGMIQSTAALHALLVKGLKTYFGVSTDTDLLAGLQLGGSMEPSSSTDSIPLPASAPWLTGDGVVFRYLPYEIACYAAGAPTVTIPASEIAPLLTSEGRSFLGLKPQAACCGGSKGARR